MGPDAAAPCGARTIGTSPAFLAVEQLLTRFARCDASVLIEGATGTGKELAARTVHYRSERRSGPFVPINCGAIPDSLLESELFGHRKGAFTDARQSTPGVLLLADGGTLFLDEVDALTPKAQVALLRFLQDRKVRALGGETERHADVRIVAACNRALSELIRSGEFRADLYYRLSVLTVELPPLRERGEDVCLLAEHFLSDLAQRYGGVVPRIDDASRAWLLTYGWPGNVRELENLIEREFHLSERGSVLHFSDVPRTAHAPSPSPNPIPSTVFPGYGQELSTCTDQNYRKAKALAVEAFDRRFLSQLLHNAHGNLSEAARMAGKDRRDLGRLLRKYRIQPEHFRA